MTIIKDGGPAFATSGLSGLPNGEFLYGQSGATLRDYFAAAAIKGLLSSVRSGELTAEDFARDAFAQADAMIVERERSHD
jgi:hypothetical protein